MKKIKVSTRIFAVTMAIVVFGMSSNNVLAANYGIEELTNSQELLSGDVVYAGRRGMKVFINNVEVATSVSEYTMNGSYTVTVNDPDPYGTTEPYELYLEQSNGGDALPSRTPEIVPSANPSSEPSNVPSSTPAAPAATPSATPGTVPTPTPIAGNGYRHTCTYDWIITLEPTMETDGILSYMCEECQGVLKTQPISKYHAILKEIEKKITSAPEGATIEIEYDFLQSLPKWIIDLLDERADLTVKVTFKTDNTWYTFTIPARDEEDKLAEDGMNYYGFHSFGDKYGKRELEK